MEAYEQDYQEWIKKYKNDNAYLSSMLEEYQNKYNSLKKDYDRLLSNTQETPMEEEALPVYEDEEDDYIFTGTPEEIADIMTMDLEEYPDMGSIREDEEEANDEDPVDEPQKNAVKTSKDVYLSFLAGENDFSFSKEPDDNEPVKRTDESEIKDKSIKKFHSPSKQMNFLNKSGGILARMLTKYCEASFEKKTKQDQDNIIFIKMGEIRMSHEKREIVKHIMNNDSIPRLALYRLVAKDAAEDEFEQLLAIS
jgi:hypothetical protein